MTNPFGMSKWHEAGWRPPTPHQVLSVVMLLLSAATVVVTFLGPPWLAAALAVLTGGSGYSATSAARMYLSPQIRNKLEAVDAKGLDAMEQPEVKQ